MSGPTVSVYMTVFNGARYLPAAIESILGQTWRDLELVIVDDGSTDGVPEILEQYRNRDSRVRVITQKNRGRPQALNTAWRATTGELCANMDPDDISEPFRIEKQVEFMRGHPEVVAVSGAMLMVDPDEWPIWVTHPPLSHEEIDERHLSAQSGLVLSHGAMMVRRSALEAVGGYDESYPQAQDMELCLRLATVGRLANLDMVLYRYRQHASSVGYAKRMNQFQLTIRAAVEARKRRGLPPPQRISREPKVYGEVECHMRWARWALKAQQGDTARKHARFVLAKRPWLPDAWWLYLKCRMAGPNQPILPCSQTAGASSASSAGSRETQG